MQSEKIGKGGDELVRRLPGPEQIKERLVELATESLLLKGILRTMENLEWQPPQAAKRSQRELAG